MTVIDTNPRRFGCKWCGSRWSGFGHCHCPTCHRTFSGISTFDAHRSGTKRRAGGQCYDPADVQSGGQAQDANGVWGTGERKHSTPPPRALPTSDEINRLPGSPGHPPQGSLL